MLRADELIEQRGRPTHALVESLARPGGNVTGYSDAAPEVTAKYLTLLKKLLPRVQRFGILWQAGNPYYRAARGQFEPVFQSLGLVPIIVKIGAAGEIDAAIGHLVANVPRPW
jgi:putative tryptophan/tyrosine transport system substrate-binding protein